MAKTTYVDKVNGTKLFAERAEYTKSGKNIDSELDSKLNKVQGAVVGDLAVFDTSGNVVDSTIQSANLVHDAAYVHTDNNFTNEDVAKLATVSSGAEPNVQADWNQTSTSADDYIKNKPTALSQFTDDITVDIYESSGSAPVNGKAVADALGALSGYKTIQDPVSDPTASGTSTEFIDSISQDVNGVITATKKSVPEVTTSNAGLMTASDKTKLNGIEAGAQVNVIETVKVNGTALTPTSKAVDISVPTAGTSDPSMDGAASAGSATTWSKSDHVHPTDTTREAVANKDDSIPSIPTSGHYPSTNAVVQFVNSSISTSTANFLGTFDVESDLHLTTEATDAEIAAALGARTWETTPTNNDYVFVTVDDPYTTTTSAEYRRFKYNGSAWAYEYTLNNSSFTQSQWDAINSSITSGQVASYNAHLSNTNNPHSVTKDQVGLGSVGNFLAVSTEAGQGLTETQKTDARTNIDAGTYSKPTNGIPSTDMTSDVQTSLGKADTAIQGVKVDGASVSPDSDKIVSIPTATTSASGTVQLAGSIASSVQTENNKAASEKAVRDAIDALNVENKADKVTGATSGNFAGLDDNGNLTDSGKNPSDFATSTHDHGNITNDGKIGSTADLAVVTTTGGAVTTANLTTSAPSASGTAIAFIDSVSQDSKGKITATKKTVQSASTTQAGLMSAEDKEKLISIASGAQVNVIETIKANGTTLSISDKTVDIPLATSAAYGLVTVSTIMLD